MAVNSFVVTSKKWFDMKIDAEQSEKLLKDITTKFLTKLLKIRFYYYTCEPFLCEKYCFNPDHEKAPNCSNCKISGDCTGLNEHWQHCILYNCDASAFRDNLGEICSEL